MIYYSPGAFFQTGFKCTRPRLILAWVADEDERNCPPLWVQLQLGGCERTQGCHATVGLTREDEMMKRGCWGCPVVMVWLIRTGRTGTGSLAFSLSLSFSAPYWTIQPGTKINRVSVGVSSLLYHQYYVQKPAQNVPLVERIHVRGIP